jgi:hypothetical protein
MFVAFISINGVQAPIRLHVTLPRDIAAPLAVFPASRFLTRSLLLSTALYRLTTNISYAIDYCSTPTENNHPQRRLQITAVFLSFVEELVWDL